MTMVGVQEAGPWMVGIQRNDYFTGREAVLDALHSELLRNGRAALSGLGGIGKTQIAAEYAYRFRAQYSAAFWLNAADSSGVACSLMQIAELIGLPEQRPEDDRVAAEAVLRYLETADDWLIVYDGADEPEFLKKYMPRFGCGHIIVTTRAQVLDSLGIAKPIEIPAMTPAEALSFVLRRTGRESARGVELESAERLVQKLGYLPLALEQAAAFIAGRQSRFQAYMEAYDGQCLELLERARPVAGDPEKSVTTTWIIAFESLESTPIAADILAMSAFLAAEEIPLELLQQGASELGPHIAVSLGNSSDELLLDEALEPLTRYSLIHRNILARTFTVHRLVQEVARNRMRPEERGYWAQCAIRALNRVFPSGDFEAWSLCERLVPHVRRIAAYVDEEISPSLDAADLFNNAGRYLFRHGKYPDAEFMHAKALALREALLDARDLAVAVSLNNLGNAYFGQGKYLEAESLHERALAIREEALGVNHPDVAASLNNVAIICHMRGNFARAEALHRRAIDVKTRAFDANHPEMALSLDNFGSLYYDEGKYAQAEPLHRRALEIREAAFGPDHPFVAASLDNLATVYRSEGKYAEAEPLYRRAAAIDEKILGPDHHHLAESLEGLANVYRHQGRFDDAEQLCRRAVSIYEKALGTDHPDYARSLNELACLFRTQHKDGEAQILHRRALEIAQKAFGEGSAAMKHMRDDFALAVPRNGRSREKNTLTRREREVAIHVAQGRSNRAIADALSLSERTVESHVASILAKQRMNSRGQIAAYVLREPNSVPRA